MVEMVHRIQDIICDAIARLDSSTFREDKWTREEEEVAEVVCSLAAMFFEKAGVNVSVVHGILSPEAAARMGVETT